MRTLGKDTLQNNINSKGTMALYIALVVIISMICIAILLISDAPSEYRLIPFLPLTFMLCSCVFSKIYEYLFRRISITLIIGTYFFRLVILPFFICLGDYSSIIQNYSIYSHMDEGITLLMYEAMCVFLVVFFSLKDFRTPIGVNESKSIVGLNTQSSIFKLAVFTMITFEVICFVRFPELKSYVHFLIETSTSTSIIQYNKFLYMLQIVPGVIYRLYGYVFGLLQIIIPIIIIQIINKKYGIKNQKKAIFFSLIIILIVSTLMTPEKASSVIGGISLFLFVLYLYPKKAKKLIPYAIMGIVVLVFGGIIVKSKVNESSNFLKSLSVVLNSYFSGPDNVAVSVSMKSSFNVVLILSDILNSIPFMGYFTKNLESSVKIFNYNLYGDSNKSDQIIPMVGQGYFYFGFVFAPIFSCICVNLSIKFEKHANCNREHFKKYIYMYGSLLFAISPILYNFNTVVSIISTFIVILFLAKLSNSFNSDVKTKTSIHEQSIHLNQIEHLNVKIKEKKSK